VDTQSYSDTTGVLLDRSIATLEALRRKYPTFPSAEIETRVTRAAFYALMWRQPQHPDLQMWRERLEAFLNQETDPERRLHIAEPLFHYCTWIGDFAKGASLFNRLRESGDSADVTPFTRIRWCLVTAAFHWTFSGQWDECRKAIDRGLELSATTGIRVMEPLLLGNGIYGLLTCGDTATAAGFLERQAQVTVPGNVSMDKALHYSLASWHALQCNNAERAKQYAQEALTLSQGAPFPKALDHLRLAHALLQSGEHDEAVKHLAHAERIVKDMRSLSLQSECLLTRAQVAFEKDQTATGIKYLGAALALGKQSGYRGSPFARPKVDAELFTKALECEIEVDYVQELIRARRLFPQEPPFHLDNWPWAVKVYTLGEFSVLRDGQILEFPVQAQRKRLAMLKALIAFGGRAVTEEQLSEALWPDAEGGAAHQDFATTLHRLRKALDAENAIVLRNRQVSLDPQYCWVDTWAFEHWASQVEVAAELTDTEIALADKTIALYRGPFLAQDGDEAWTLAPRERLRSKFLRLVDKLAQHFAQSGHWEQAKTHYQKGLEVDPLAEEFYRQLMSCYVALNRPAEALALYERCQQTLRTTLGIIPSRETRALFDQVRAAQRN
jgi:DNA-binding SARP family transcriptional activator